MIRMFAWACLVVVLSTQANAQSHYKFEEIAVPVGADAREPSLHTGTDGQLILSWTEASAEGHALRMSVLDDGGWGPARTVVSSPELFVNWADFGAVAAFSDGTLIAQWLETSGASPFAYDVMLAVSRDGGSQWSAPFVPHADGTKSQHGFVTLAPVGDDIVAVWLDGRAYEGDLLEPGATSGAMQLRTAVIAPDGTATEDTALDFTTCSCCQTSAAMAGDTLLVVYRDRTDAEIRDISIIRRRDGLWSAPSPVHEDNWQFPGCPVNGPSISAQGERAVVAWFTAVGDVPSVNIAFSSDAGGSFGDAVRIDHGQPVGNVDTLMLEDGTALISWVEWTGDGEGVFICRATGDGCSDTRKLAENSVGGSVNFPKLAAAGGGIYIAFTQPLSNGSDTIRMLRSRW